VPVCTSLSRMPLDFSRVQHTTNGISVIVINAGIIAIQERNAEVIANIGIRACG
jgi:hypothetical protein